MLRIIKAVAVVATAFSFAVSAAYYTGAQELPKHLADDPYVIELNKIFQQWNTHDLNLPPKSKLRPLFEKRLGEIVGEHRYSYQNAYWASGMQKQFDLLPEQLKPGKALDSRAQVVLVLLFLKDKAAFEQRVSADRVRDELNLPLFLILSSAQEIAVQNGAQTVGTDSAIKALLGWWTTIWPFCG